MSGTLHFLRPWWFLALFPLLILFWKTWQYKSTYSGWKAICDAHLLPYLFPVATRHTSQFLKLLPLLSMLFLIISLTGPTWSTMPIATLHRVQPRVVLLHLSDGMLDTDLLPNRLSRAKFIIHDIVMDPGCDQIGLLVYSDESFVVSPLTEDAETLDALVPLLAPKLLPVSGDRLDSALEKAAQLVTEAGFSSADLLVLTEASPTPMAVNVAHRLAREGIHTSIMLFTTSDISIQGKALADAGKGEVMIASDAASGIQPWLRKKRFGNRYDKNAQGMMSAWRDQGRWFLIPALCCLLPFFRRMD